MGLEKILSATAKTSAIVIVGLANMGGLGSDALAQWVKLTGLCSCNGAAEVDDERLLDGALPAHATNVSRAMIPKVPSLEAVVIRCPSF